MARALLTFGAGLLAVSVTAAAAQSERTDFDPNTDNMVSKDEFAAGFGKGDTFKRWDADQSGTISQEEFSTQSFRLFDRDRDGHLNEQEFARAAEGASSLMPEGSAALQMSAFDANTDNMVSAEEFSSGATTLGGQGPFAAFDADTSSDISQEEFAAGVFRVYDRDRDGNLSTVEFTLFGEDTAFLQQQ